MSDENLQYVFPMRAWFVGILWAIGAFLYLYRGFSMTENRFLNIAGAAAIVVALFPMGVPDSCKYCGTSALAWVHFSAAGILFLCMSVVAWACTDETLVMLPEGQRKLFRATYSALALAMTVAPIAVYLLIWRGREKHPGLFWAELTGVIVFAMYWATKSFELDRLGTQQRKLRGDAPLSTPVQYRLDKGDGAKAFLGGINEKVDVLRQRAGRLLG